MFCFSASPEDADCYLTMRGVVSENFNFTEADTGSKETSNSKCEVKCQKNGGLEQDQNVSSRAAAMSSTNKTEPISHNTHIQSKIFKEDCYAVPYQEKSLKQRGVTLPQCDGEKSREAAITKVEETPRYDRLLGKEFIEDCSATLFLEAPNEKDATLTLHRDRGKGQTIFIIEEATSIEQTYQYEELLSKGFTDDNYAIPHQDKASKDNHVALTPDNVMNQKYSSREGGMTSTIEQTSHYDRLQSKELTENSYAIPVQEKTLKDGNAMCMPYCDRGKSGEAGMFTTTKPKQTSQYDRLQSKEFTEDSYAIPNHDKTMKENTTGNKYESTDIPATKKSTQRIAAESNSADLDSSHYYYDLEDVSKPSKLAQLKFTCPAYDYIEIPTSGKSIVRRNITEKDDGPTYYVLKDTSNEYYSEINTESNEGNRQVKIVKSKGNDCKAANSSDDPVGRNKTLEPDMLQKGMLSGCFYLPKQTSNLGKASLKEDIQNPEDSHDRVNNDVYI